MIAGLGLVECEISEELASVIVTDLFDFAVVVVVVVALVLHVAFWMMKIKMMMATMTVQSMLVVYRWRLISFENQIEASKYYHGASIVSPKKWVVALR